MKLIAVWDHSQDFSTEHPRCVRWEDGSQATLDAYIEHSIGTRILREDHPDQIELHMFPDVVADVIPSAQQGERNGFRTAPRPPAGHFGRRDAERFRSTDGFGASFGTPESFGI